MSRTHNIYLNSKYADVKINNSLADCIFFFQDVIEKPNPNYLMYIKLEHFTLPISMYNLDVYHNKLDYIVNNIDYSLIIPSGNYSIDTLVNYLNNNVVNLVFSYNSSSFSISINSSYNFIIKNSSTILTILGFNENTTYNSISNSLTSPNAYDLSGVNSIIIFTNFLTGNIDGRTKRNSNHLQVIPNDVANGNVLSFKNIYDNKMLIYDNHINYIAIQLQDENRNILQLNGANWDISLSVQLIPIDISNLDENQLSLFKQQENINNLYKNYKNFKSNN